MSLNNIFISGDDNDTRQPEETIQNYLSTSKSRLRSMMNHRHSQAASTASLKSQQALKQQIRKTRNEYENCKQVDRSQPNPIKNIKRIPVTASSSAIKYPPSRIKMGAVNQISSSYSNGLRSMTGGLSNINKLGVREDHRQSHTNMEVHHAEKTARLYTSPSGGVLQGSPAAEQTTNKPEDKRFSINLTNSNEPMNPVANPETDKHMPSYDILASRRPLMAKKSKNFMNGAYQSRNDNQQMIESSANELYHNSLVQDARLDTLRDNSCTQQLNMTERNYMPREINSRGSTHRNQNMNVCETTGYHSRSSVVLDSCYKDSANLRKDLHGVKAHFVAMNIKRREDEALEKVKKQDMTYAERYDILCFNAQALEIKRDKRSRRTSSFDQKSVDDLSKSATQESIKADSPSKEFTEEEERSVVLKQMHSISQFDLERTSKELQVDVDNAYGRAAHMGHEIKAEYLAFQERSTDHRSNISFQDRYLKKISQTSKIISQPQKSTFDNEDSPHQHSRHNLVGNSNHQGQLKSLHQKDSQFSLYKWDQQESTDGQIPAFFNNRKGKPAQIVQEQLCFSNEGAKKRKKMKQLASSYRREGARMQQSLCLKIPQSVATAELRYIKDPSETNRVQKQASIPMLGSQNDPSSTLLNDSNLGIKSKQFQLRSTTNLNTMDKRREQSKSSLFNRTGRDKQYGSGVN